MVLKASITFALAAVGMAVGAPPPISSGVSWRTTFIPIPVNDIPYKVPSWNGVEDRGDSLKYAVNSLPDSPPISPSWAGRIGVPGESVENQMFFWLFETEDKAYDEQLIIWLNGGPGCSSMIGAFAENGPLMYGNSSKMEQNPFSWTKLGHVLYVDQPVGTGFSIAGNPTPAVNIEMVTNLFYKWLRQFFTTFPHLRQKRIHLTGESYAGIYIPYFAERILKNNDEFLINLTSIAIGNGAIGNNVAMSDVVAGAYIRKKAGDLKISRDIIDAFTEAERICGFDSVLKNGTQYPPNGHFYLPQTLHNASGFTGDQDCNIKPKTPNAVLSSILNSTCYGQCAIYSTARDHIDAIREKDCFNMYNIDYNCHTPNPLIPLTSYLNRADVQTALNILPSKQNTPHRFEVCNQTILDSLFSPLIRPIPPAESILPSILSTYKLPVHLYQGQRDMVINHIAVELALQNMTWNGHQGFQKRPSIPFGSKVNIGKKEEVKDPSMVALAGLWAYERGLTYHLFRDAGHGVPRDQPEEMWHYIKNVIDGAWNEGLLRGERVFSA
ncbi:hypothetical protein LOZ53_004342 [Ophidiomyces ophidiicola]|nr:hypothetical protein LOZ55_002443 [Ophidiomyces ophidiicola]KAI1987473.1 hypothetical protein LOZ53_004342 [Ophidiomyces ophidiicola]KAI1988086.1 hypothetical protein LOZ51_005567 [Ophidiomyces ophidiicola]KAI1988356.1 hypothetical protein LOZ54_003251 [Ophidiomyces ophidiicola]